MSERTVRVPFTHSTMPTSGAIGSTVYVRTASRCAPSPPQRASRASSAFMMTNSSCTRASRRISSPPLTRNTCSRASSAYAISFFGSRIERNTPRFASNDATSGAFVAGGDCVRARERLSARVHAHSSSRLPD
jgi:hypothetical protein